jgi:regulator of Ty1 transposition protein 103
VLWILEFDAQETWLMTYLIVEVAQQSKARRKDDFLIAFSPVIAEATATAYKGATNEVQQKLRRVVEVWRQRQIFESPIQDAIEARIEGMSIQH